MQFRDNTRNYGRNYNEPFNRNTDLSVKLGKYTPDVSRVQFKDNLREKHSAFIKRY